MKRRHIVLASAVLGLGVIVAGFFGWWQLADRPPSRYVECESNMAEADCGHASQAFEDCRQGRVEEIGRSNCRHMIDLHTACGQRKGVSNDITCRVVAHDYLKCTISGNGALACALIEQAFLSCLDNGREDVPACKAVRGQRMDCLSPRNLKKERCRQLNDEILNAPVPSWPVS
jgi:hypothetical protein